MTEESAFLTTIDEIDALPDRAVVYDHDNVVWQKRADHDQGFPDIGYGYWWYRPGEVDGFLSGAIVLPARQLIPGRWS